MKDTTKNYRTQLEAAYDLLRGETTNLDKIDKLKTLLTGINPKIDKYMNEVSTTYTHLRAALNTDVIHLTAHGLSDSTSQQRKNKKLLLLFLGSWKTLKGEVERVRGYYQESGESYTTRHTAASAAKTVVFAKGPFGLITAVAVIAVAGAMLYKNMVTTVTLENSGCTPIELPTSLPVNIPGLTLPQGPVAMGQSVSIKLPAIKVTIVGTSRQLTATAFGQTGGYTLPSKVTDVTFDSASLLNKTTELNLKSSFAHVLVMSCQ